MLHVLSWWLTAGKGQNQGENKSPQSQLSLACENVQQMTLVFAKLHAMSQFSSFCLFKCNLLHETLNLVGSSCYVASCDATATSDLVIERVQCKYVNISVIWCTDGKRSHSIKLMDWIKPDSLRWHHPFIFWEAGTHPGHTHHSLWEAI